MGNRAVVAWTDTRGNFDMSSTGVYLHWNGGRDSIEAFLGYCEMMGFRSPSYDNYGIANFVTVVSNFFGDGLSVGVDSINKLCANNGDNGLYICNGWHIVDRKFFEGCEQNEHNFSQIVSAINEAQPNSMRKSDEELDEMISAYLAKRKAA